MFAKLYDLGLREGDIIPALGSFLDEFNSYKFSDFELWVKVREFLHGAF
jgi:hypothetical protein